MHSLLMLEARILREDLNTKWKYKKAKRESVSFICAPLTKSVNNWRLRSAFLSIAASKITNGAAFRPTIHCTVLKQKNRKQDLVFTRGPSKFFNTKDIQFNQKVNLSSVYLLDHPLGRRCKACQVRCRIGLPLASDLASLNFWWRGPKIGGAPAPRWSQVVAETNLLW